MAQAEKEAVAEITKKPVAAAEGEIIKPKEEEKKIEVPMVPVAVPPAAPPAIPAALTLEMIPEPFVTTKAPYTTGPAAPVIPLNPLLIDIETTTAEPHLGRIMCIGYIDPKTTQSDIIFNDDEEALVKQFIDFYTNSGYDQIVGYNVSFDIRYIFARCLRYQIPASIFLNSAYYDLMQIMKQVKMAFVFTMNKPHGLYDWAKYLFNVDRHSGHKEILEAWEKKDLNFIRAHNEQDLNVLFNLYNLIQFVMLST